MPVRAERDADHASRASGRATGTRSTWSSPSSASSPSQSSLRKGAAPKAKSSSTLYCSSPATCCNLVASPSSSAGVQALKRLQRNILTRHADPARASSPACPPSISKLRATHLSASISISTTKSSNRLTRCCARPRRRAGQGGHRARGRRSHSCWRATATAMRIREPCSRCIACCVCLAACPDPSRHRHAAPPRLPVRLCATVHIA